MSLGFVILLMSDCLGSSTPNFSSSECDVTTTYPSDFEHSIQDKKSTSKYKTLAMGHIAGSDAA